MTSAPLGRGSVAGIGDVAGVTGTWGGGVAYCLLAVVCKPAVKEGRDRLNPRAAKLDRDSGEAVRAVKNVNARFKNSRGDHSPN